MKIWYYLSILLICVSNCCALTAMGAQVVENEQESLVYGTEYVRGDKQRIPVAVLNVLYALRYNLSGERYLAKDHDKMFLTDETSTQTFFYFQRVEGLDNLYELVAYDGTKMGKLGKERCAIEVVNRTEKLNRINFGFSFVSDEYPLYLVVNADRLIASYSMEHPSQNSWCLIPQIDFRPVIEKKIDTETQLVALSLNSFQTNFKLTKKAIELLWKLSRNGGELLVVTMDENRCHVCTSDMLYYRGMQIFSPDCPLELSGLEACKILACGSDDAVVEGVCDEFRFGSSKRFLILPHREREALKTHLFGKIKIHFVKKGGFCGLVPEKTVYVGTLLHQVLDQRTHLVKDCIIKVHDNTVIVYDTTTPIPTLGYGAFLTDVVGTKLVGEAAKKAQIVVKGATTSLENASNNLGVALVASSSKLSESIVIGFASLSSSIKHGAEIFETSINLLVLMGNSLNTDLCTTAKITGRQLERASKNMQEALFDASDNLVGCSKEIRAGITDASEDFNSAFTLLSNKLKESADSISKGAMVSAETISDSVRVASENFIKAMEKVRQAAQNIDVNMSWFGIGKKF